MRFLLLAYFFIGTNVFATDVRVDSDADRRHITQVLLVANGDNGQMDLDYRTKEGHFRAIRRSDGRIEYGTKSPTSVLQDPDIWTQRDKRQLDVALQDLRDLMAANLF